MHRSALPYRPQWHRLMVCATHVGGRMAGLVNGRPYDSMEVQRQMLNIRWKHLSYVLWYKFQRGQARHCYLSRTGKKLLVVQCNIKWLIFICCQHCRLFVAEPRWDLPLKRIGWDRGGCVMEKASVDMQKLRSFYRAGLDMPLLDCHRPRCCGRSCGARLQEPPDDDLVWASITLMYHLDESLRYYDEEQKTRSAYAVHRAQTQHN